MTLKFIILLLITSCQSGSSSNSPTATTSAQTSDSDQTSSVTPTVSNPATNQQTTSEVSTEETNTAVENPVVAAESPLVNSDVKSSTMVSLYWNQPQDNGTSITDYLVEYKDGISDSWTIYEDGISQATEVSLEGLSPATNYSFRVSAFNGSFSSPSESLTVRTQDDSAFFNPTTFKLMNVAGATNSRMVALEDDTTITLADGVSTVNLGKGETFSFTSARGDIVESDKAVFIAGSLAFDTAAARSANVVWSPPGWSGHDFVLNLERSKPHLLTIYTFSEGEVTIGHADNEPTTYNFAANEFNSLSVSTNGNYQIHTESSALIYVYSKASNNISYVDPRPILPPSNDIIGFPSTAAKVTVDTDDTSITRYIADGSTETMSGFKADVMEHSGTGDGSIEQFTGFPSRYMSTGGKLAAMSYGDGDGTCATSYLPTHLQKKRYAVNTSADFVAFASTEPATITVRDGSGTLSEIQLTRTGTTPNSPYYARLSNQDEGSVYESDTPFAAWYQPNSNLDAAELDETIMVGFN